MKMNTKIFGEVEVDDEKIISFPNGIIGFPQLNHFAMMHNADRPDARASWLVSVEEPAFALPVIDPLIIKEDYNPVVNDDLLLPLGNLDDADYLVLSTISVPKGNPQGVTTNLKAPIIINTVTKKGTQIILDGEEYPIKLPIYDIIKKDNGKEDK